MVLRGRAASESTEPSECYLLGESTVNYTGRGSFSLALRLGTQEFQSLQLYRRRPYIILSYSDRA